MDPFTAQASQVTADKKKKIEDLKGIIKSTQTAMLTTRSIEGHLHSRAMAPVSSSQDRELEFIFLGNNASHKFDEIRNDENVNVAFLNPSTTAWASVAGKAKVINDKHAIKKYWSKNTSAWFGDLKDSVHRGDENDPRVSLIEVIPDEDIRYWWPTKTKIIRAIGIKVGAITGQVATPGELRMLSPKEIYHQ